MTKQVDTDTKHIIVGDVHDHNLTSQGSYVYILAKRKNPSTTPIVLGQYLILIDEEQPKKSYFCLAEEFAPDYQVVGSAKDVIRNRDKSGKPIDRLYRDQLLYLGYKCRLIGVCKEENDGSIKFFSNVRSLPDVYQLKAAIPSPEFMRKLFMNAVEANDNEEDKPVIFEIGYLRYGTNPDDTDCYKIGTENQVEVQFNVTNLLRKRTAIFGKSGYGKSNTVKTVIGMIAKERQTVGQLILDTNGEYARDNDQNKGFMDIFHEANLKNKTVLYTNRNIGTSFKKKYGEKSIKALKFDVFANIKPAFEIVEANLSTQKEAPIYLQPWLSSLMEEDESRFFADIWNPGLIFAIYYRCLYSAGLTPISEHHSYNGDLIVSKKFLGMIGVRHQVNNKNVKEDDAQTVFDELDEESKKEIISSLRIKKDGNTYICQHIPTMVEYASWYVDVVLKAKNSDGEASSIKGFAELMANPRRLYALKSFHLKKTDENHGTSLGESIFQDLKDAKIVMMDLSSVPMKIAKSLSRHVCSHILNKASNMFGDDAQRISFNKFDAIIYIEESQNYLSKEELSSGSSIYERLAKEGRKFHLGLVYVTQQPSAIDPSVTSQTENIIALHMSNETDCFILNKIKDKFDPLTCRFLKDEAAKGLSYIYAEPHQPFVLPCQIKEFNANLIIGSKKK